MNIQEIKINNFLSFKEAEFDFSNKGLTLITGNNKDNSKRSNGSGKSSIIEALVWGVFGETTKRLKSDDVINREEFSDCSVLINISDLGNEYRIERYRKHFQYKNDIKFFVNNEEKKGKTNTETQEIINRELGIDFKIFTNSVLFPQESKFKFVSATDNEKKEILTEILDLGYIDEANIKISEKLKVLNLEIHDEKISLDNLDKKKFELEEEAVSFVEKSAKFEEDRSKEIISFKNKINDYEKKITLLHNEAKEIQKKNEDFELERKKYIKKLKEEKQNLEERISFIKIENYDEQKEKINKLEKKLETINETRDARDSKNNQLRKILINIDKINDGINESQNKIKKFEKLGKTDCPTCLQEISNEHVHSISKVYIGKVEELNVELKKEMENKDKLEKKIKSYDELISLETKIKKKIRNLELEINEIKEKTIELKSLKDKLLLFDEKIDNKIKENNPFTLNEDNIESNVNQFKEQIKYIESQINNKNKEKNLYNEMIASHNEKIKKIKEDIKNNSLIVKGKEENVLYYEFWKEGFSNKGLKSFIFDGIINDLNDKMEEYLDEMFDGILKVIFSNESITASGEIRQKLSTNITYDGEEVTFESLSGGEKRSISLAIDLALSDLIAQRNFKKFGLLIMDEATDHLDSIGKERFLDLLQTLQKDSIFIISHDEQFQQKFDNIIKIQKENGESLIT